MSLGRTLKASFSPHEIAIMGIVLSATLGIFGIIGIGTGRGGFGIMLWLAAAIIEMTFYQLSRCACGQSPIVRYHISMGGFEMPVWRLWPERECSGCGATLTGPEQA